MTALLGLRDPGFAVLSGDDATACRAMLHGADGVISVASNVVRACSVGSAIWRARAMRGATAVDAQLHALYDFLGVEPNPISRQGAARAPRVGHGLRLPLTDLSAAHAEAATRLAGQVQQLETACRNAVAA